MPRPRGLSDLVFEFVFESKYIKYWVGNTADASRGKTQKLQ